MEACSKAREVGGGTATEKQAQRKQKMANTVGSSGGDSPVSPGDAIMSLWSNFEKGLQEHSQSLVGAFSGLLTIHEEGARTPSAEHVNSRLSSDPSTRKVEAWARKCASQRPSAEEIEETANMWGVQGIKTHQLQRERIESLLSSKSTGPRSTGGSSSAGSVGSRRSSKSSASSQGYRVLTEQQRFEEMVKATRGRDVQSALLVRQNQAASEVIKMNRAASHKSGYIVKSGKRITEVDLAARREVEAGRELEHSPGCSCSKCASKVQQQLISRQTEDRLKAEIQSNKKMTELLRSKVSSSSMRRDK